MNITEIQERLDALAKAMGEKGLPTPEAQYHINSGRAGVVCLQWGEYPEKGFELFRSGVANDDLADAAAFVAALPSPEERHRAQFLKLAGAAADYAADHLPGDEIAAEVRATIVAGMQRLSENAIAAE